MSAPKSIQSLLGTSGQFDKMSRKISRLSKINTIVLGHLSAPINQHIHVANLEQDQLVLHIDSSSWAALLRMQIPGLIEQLKQHHGLTTLNNIRIKIKPVTGNQTITKQHRQAHLSTQSGDIIRDYADNISDKALKTALLRLANRSKRQ